jgi:hypothetical protein
MDLQRRHQKIIDDNKEPTTVKQASLVELHKLSITLSNLYDVATDIVNHATVSTTSQGQDSKESESERQILV